MVIKWLSSYTSDYVALTWIAKDEVRCSHCCCSFSEQVRARFHVGNRERKSIQVVLLGSTPRWMVRFSIANLTIVHSPYHVGIENGSLDRLLGYFRGKRCISTLCKRDATQRYSSSTQMIVIDCEVIMHNLEVSIKWQRVFPSLSYLLEIKSNV